MQHQNGEHTIELFMATEIELGLALNGMLVDPSDMMQEAGMSWVCTPALFAPKTHGERGGQWKILRRVYQWTE